MTDLGALNYFLRVSITRDSTAMFVSHKKYAMKLLEWEHIRLHVMLLELLLTQNPSLVLMVILYPILLYIVALQVVCSISCLLVQIYLMLCNILSTHA